MAYTRQIDIKWTYPKEMHSAYNSDDAYGQGIYQISRIWGGIEKLLYIGLVKSAYRDFYIRLDEHWPWLKSEKGKILLRFGHILGKQGQSIDEGVYETIEGALIFQLQPLRNTMKLNSYTVHYDMFICSSGYRGFVPKTLNTNDHLMD